MEINWERKKLKCAKCNLEADTLIHRYMTEYGIKIEARLCKPCLKEFNRLIDKFFGDNWLMTYDF